MINSPGITKGLYLKCSKEGKILLIRQNGLSLPVTDGKSELFITLFLPEDTENAMDFFASVNNKGAEFGRKLRVLHQNQPLELFFSGAMVDDFQIISASEQKIGFSNFLNEMLLLSNEQTNLIRVLYKEKSQAAEPINSRRSDHFLNEISRINNELTAIQRELAKKNKELSELNKLKNNLLGMAAHDIRNPLSMIMDYCDIINEELDKDITSARNHLMRINHFARFSLNIVNNFLTGSAIKAGKLTLYKKNYSLKDVLEEAVEFNSYTAKARNIRLRLECELLSCKSNFDYQKILQVLNNLISNAIKFSESGSEVELRAVYQDEKFLIEVIDKGKGISKTDLERLFTPFGVAESSSEKESSTGLGLIIAKKIINTHGGEIGVESEPDKGSRFYFTLPAEKSQN